MNRPRRHLLTVIALTNCVFAAIWPGRSVADNPVDTVVLVTMSDCCLHAAYPEAEAALADELTLIGLQIVRVKGTASDELEQRRELAQSAAAHRALAAIRVFRAAKDGPADAGLWITAPSTDQNVYRRIQVASASAGLDAMVVAVRTVETLRASLQEFQVEKKSTVTPSVTPAVKQAAAPKTSATGHLLGFSFYGGMDFSPGGIGRRGAFGGALLSEPLPGLDILLSVDGSPIGETLHANDVLSSLTYTTCRGWIYYRFFPHSPVRPSLGLGAGALWARAEGQTDAGEPLLSVNTVTAYLGGAARVTVFAKEMLSLFFDTRVGIMLPEASVVHGSVLSASFGRPLVELRLGVTLRFFPLCEFRGRNLGDGPEK